MATRTWTGAAAPIAQVDSFAFAGTWIIGETITVTYGQKAWTYTTTSASISTIITGLVAAYNALSSANFPEFLEQTAAGSATPMTLTASTAGKPFRVTITTNSASGTILRSGTNEVQTLTFNATATGGTMVLIVPKTDQTLATTASIAWNATDATWLANINSALDTATGVTGGIVATGATPDSAITFTFSGGGFRGATHAMIEASTFPTSVSSATYARTTRGVPTTDSTGPYHWDSAANWSNSTLPAAGDTVILDKLDTQILYGLQQNGFTITNLFILTNRDTLFELGLPLTNSGGYAEYRPLSLLCNVTNCTIRTAGGRTNIDFGTVQSAITVESTGISLESGIPPCNILGTNTSNAFSIVSGDIGIAYFSGQSAAASTITISSGSVQCGLGVTLSTITNIGGSLVVNTAISTSLTTYGGSTFLLGTGAIAQITCQGGSIVYNTTGTLGGTTTLSGTGILSFDGNLVTKTVTNPIDVYGDSADVYDTNKVVSTLIIDYNQTFRFGKGPNFRFTRGTVA